MTYYTRGETVNRSGRTAIYSGTELLEGLTLSLQAGEDLLLSMTLKGGAGNARFIEVKKSDPSMNYGVKR